MIQVRFLLLSCCMMVWSCGGVRYDCSTIQCIETNFPNLMAGDEMVLAPGNYIQVFLLSSFRNDAWLSSSTAGTADAPIIFRGLDPSDKPVVWGADVTYWDSFRLLDGAHHWKIQDIVFQRAFRGIMIDASDYVEISGVEINTIGQEAIHIRDGSKHTLIENCEIFETGRRTPGFGEGIYVGSDRGAWNQFASDVVNTTIRGCIIGPNVRGEPLDIKEGTTDTLIEDIMVNASGLSGENFADSFIDIKGTRTTVRYSTFYQGGDTSLVRGVAVLDRDRPLSGEENVIHGNDFFLDSASIPLVDAGGGTRDTFAYDNTKVPEGNPIATGDVTETCCPDWYEPPGINVCFSGTATVEVLNYGMVPLHQVAIGDQVHVGNGRYEAIYSFGHYDPNRQTELLRITTAGGTFVDVSSNHLLYVDRVFIPASQLQPGEFLSDGYGSERLVSSVTKVTSRGLYAPFTPSGQLVVNGILASSFVSITNTSHLSVFYGYQFSHHWLGHTFEFPHRLVCHYLTTCRNEQYDSQGLSTWISKPFHFFQSLMRNPKSLETKFIMTAMLVPLAIFVVVEEVVLNSSCAAVVLAMGVLLMMTWRISRTMTKSQNSCFLKT